MPAIAGVGLAVVLLTAVSLGYALRRLGQPPVIGEIAAAFLLCPVGLGAVSPTFYYLLFPPSVQPLYAAVGHVGLVMFLFSLGYEFRVEALAHRSEVVAAAAAGFVVPAVLGALVGLVVYRSAADQAASSLFLAAAVSATALPVLSRILLDYCLSDTRLGRVALSAAALIDLLVWLLLAAAVLLAGQTDGSWRPELLGVALLAVLIAVRAGFGRKLRRVAGQLPRQPLLLSGLAIAFLGAAATDSLGLHAAAGALVAGLLFPRAGSAAPTPTSPNQRSGVDDVRTFGQALLPVFFMSVLMGVQVQPQIQVLTEIALLLPLAVIGKVLPGYVVGRAHAWTWRDAMALGFLLNTRGVTEFVVISIGLKASLIAPSTYLALAVVAVVTTATTGPVVVRLLGPQRDDPATS